MTRFLLLALLTVSFAACDKDNNNNKTNCGTSVEDKLTATWTLTEAFNPWTQQDDIANAGVYKELEFQSGGTLIMRDTGNGDTQTDTWELNADNPNELITVAGGWYSYTVNCDSLVLDGTPVDGHRYTYVRQ